MIRALFIIFLLVSLLSCRENYTPKPKGFFKVELPEKKYQLYTGSCPYTFEYPVYARIEKDQSKNTQPCWFNVVYLPFNARLHMSYKTFESKEKLYEMEEDAYNMAYKHSVKAEAINENVIKTSHGVYGILYDLEGNTATTLQFYITDKKKHYLRGALYFDVKTNRDSLEPMISFLRKDIERMISTLEWK